MWLEAGYYKAQQVMLCSEPVCAKKLDSWFDLQRALKKYEK